mmetsp:Transcript_26146/g.78490  ORF Transcript_26146/g.78490 Transcript_26146/m.78490 type:complete len:164 (-) Transcript_26146:32-523(-)
MRHTLARVARTQPICASARRHASVEPWTLGRLNHVAIAVPDMAAASETWRAALNAKISDPQTLPEHGVTVRFVDAGNTHVELLEPLGEASPIAAFLKKNPSGGLHHLCHEVPDVAAAMADLKAKGVRLLSDEPRIGAHGVPVVFLHPKDTNGVLVELQESIPS